MTWGAFQKSELAGRTIAAPVILRSVKSIHPGLCVLHLGLKWTWVTTQYIYFFLNRAKKAVKLPTESHYVEHRLVRTDLTTGEVQLDEHAIACLNKV